MSVLVAITRLITRKFFTVSVAAVNILPMGSRLVDIKKLSEELGPPVRTLRTLMLISSDDVRRVFEGSKELTRSQARDALMALTGGSRSSYYAALNQLGNHLEEVGGKLKWKQ